MIAPPNAEGLLRLWERGEGEHPIDRALSMLATFCGIPAVEELARLDVGRRDALLFKSRASLFGPAINGLATCERCACTIEVSLTPPEPGTQDEIFETGDAWLSLSVEGRAIEYRLPTSVDLEAVARCDSIETAYRQLRQRCIRGADDADEAALAKVAREIARRAEPASLDVSLDCPECGRSWSLDFDIAAFFWEELRLRARRLLRDVDALARRYGWSERDILALSDTRRRHYLELAS